MTKEYDDWKEIWDFTDKAIPMLENAIKDLRDRVGYVSKIVEIANSFDDHLRDIEALREEAISHCQRLHT